MSSQVETHWRSNAAFKDHAMLIHTRAYLGAARLTLCGPRHPQIPSSGADNKLAGCPLISRHIEATDRVNEPINRWLDVAML